MKNLLTAITAVLGVVFVYGFVFPAEKSGRVTITTRAEKPDYTVTVTLFDIAPNYRWVSLRACTAERAEDMQAYCTSFWERESTQETRVDQQQYPFRWRNVPGGLLLITAVAFDIDDRVLAKQTLAIHKGY